VTICAAAINQGSIIAIQDTNVSFFGGSVSAEGMAWKERQVNKQWEVLFSGDISTLTPMLAAIQEAGKKSKHNDLRQFARLCAKAYRAERERIIEDEVLPDYDLATYAEYLQLKNNEPQLFETIGARIKDAEEGWHLLFCGFDEKRRPHLFVISGRGKIQYCDTPGFAAIGSGSWATYIALASYPYNTALKREEATYCLLAAKFASESAEGVGLETVIHIIEPGSSYSTFLLDDTINNVRDKWRTLPRIPIGVADEIKTALAKFQGVIIKGDKGQKKKKADSHTSQEEPEK
jgi:20S proteasome alpha/beta subunit